MKTLLILLLLASPAFADTIYLSTTKDKAPKTTTQLDNYAGLGERRDEEQNRKSHALHDEAMLKGGVVLLSGWTWKKKFQFHCMVRNPDGSYNGPNFPMGHMTSGRRESVFSYAR